MLTVERLREVLSYDALTGEFRWKLALSRRCRVGQIAGSDNGKGYILIRLGVILIVVLIWILLGHRV